MQRRYRVEDVRLEGQFDRLIIDDRSSPGLVRVVNSAQLDIKIVSCSTWRCAPSTVDQAGSARQRSKIGVITMRQRTCHSLFNEGIKEI